MGPRVLYLHGFASGPGSKKGVAVAARLAERGIELARLDLRVPSLERLSLGAMIATTRAAIGAPRDRAILIGSSLGGLVASRLAEDEPRVCALVLLAPALRFHERWRERLGEDGWADWMTSGWLAVHDHQTGETVRVHADFAREAEALDRGGDGWPDVRVPTLILHGTRDPVVPIELSRRFAAGKPHVRVIELDDDHELLATLPRILDEIDRVVS